MQGFESFVEKQMDKLNLKAEYNTKEQEHKRLMRYLKISPPQTKITFINILSYTNDKPHTMFENTLSK